MALSHPRLVPCFSMCRQTLGAKRVRRLLSCPTNFAIGQHTAPTLAELFQAAKIDAATASSSRKFLPPNVPN